MFVFESKVGGSLFKEPIAKLESCEPCLIKTRTHSRFEPFFSTNQNKSGHPKTPQDSSSDCDENLVEPLME